MGSSSVNNPSPQPAPIQPAVSAKISTDNDQISVLVTIGDTTYRVNPVYNGKVVDLSDPGLIGLAERVKQEALDILSKKPATSIDLKQKTFARDVETKDLKTRVQQVVQNRNAVERRDTKFDKNVPQTAAKVVAKVGAGLGIVLASPFLGAAKLGHALSTRVSKLRGKRDVRDAVKEMNEREKTARFETLQKNLGLKEGDEAEKKEVIERSVERMSVYVKARTTEDRAKKLLEQKLIGRLEVSLKRSDSYEDDEIKDNVAVIKAEIRNQPLTPRDLKDPIALKKYISKVAGNTDVISSVSDEDLKDIVNESKLLVVPNKEQQIKADMQLWKNFLDANAAETGKNNPVGEANLKVLKALRAVLGSQSYLALKDDPSNLWILGIHNYVVASYKEVKAADIYEKFGKKLASAPGMADATMDQRVKAAHDYAKSQNLTDHGAIGKLVYIATHWKQAMGALSSQGGVASEIAKMFGTENYDPAMLGNVPSLQGTTTMKILGGNEVQVHNIYGGNPTIGGEISPEYHALGQAMLNNAKRSGRAFALAPDPMIPEAVVYTDLQNNLEEAERGFAMKKLADLYPGRFITTTLSKDSDFYHMKGSYENGGSMTAQKFGEQFLGILSDDSCYEVKNRSGSKKDAGIYLPFGKEFWVDERGEGRLKEIIESVNVLFAGKRQPMLAEGMREFRYAYQEAVYNLIGLTVEMEVAKKVSPNGNIWTQYVCKEGIDRGAIHSFIIAYLRGSLNNDQLMGLLNSRAFSSRDRVIIEGRLKVLVAFLKHVDRDEMVNLINAMASVKGVSSVKFEAASVPDLTGAAAVEERAPGVEAPEPIGSLKGTSLVFQRVTGSASTEVGNPKVTTSRPPIVSDLPGATAGASIIVAPNMESDDESSEDDGFVSPSISPQVSSRPITPVTNDDDELSLVEEDNDGNIGGTSASSGDISLSDTSKLIAVKDITPLVAQIVAQAATSSTATNPKAFLKAKIQEIQAKAELSNAKGEITPESSKQFLQRMLTKASRELNNDGVVDQFVCDIARNGGFQIIDERKGINDLVPQPASELSKEEKIIEGVASIKRVIGEKDVAWEAVLQAVPTQISLNRTFGDLYFSPFKTAGMDNPWRDSAGPARLDVRFSNDKLPPVQLTVARNPDDSIDYVDVSFVKAVDVIKMNEKSGVDTVTAVMSEGIVYSASFRLTLDPGGNPVVDELKVASTMNDKVDFVSVKTVKERGDYKGVELTVEAEYPLDEPSEVPGKISATGQNHETKTLELQLYRKQPEITKEQPRLVRSFAGILPRFVTMKRNDDYVEIGGFWAEQKVVDEFVNTLNAPSAPVKQTNPIVHPSTSSEITIDDAERLKAAAFLKSQFDPQSSSQSLTASSSGVAGTSMGSTSEVLHKVTGFDVVKIGKQKHIRMQFNFFTNNNEKVIFYCYTDENQKEKFKDRIPIKWKGKTYHISKEEFEKRKVQAKAELEESMVKDPTPPPAPVKQTNPIAQPSTGSPKPAVSFTGVAETSTDSSPKVTYEVTLVSKGTSGKLTMAFLFKSEYDERIYVCNVVKKSKTSLKPKGTVEIVYDNKTYYIKKTDFAKVEQRAEKELYRDEMAHLVTGNTIGPADSSRRLEEFRLGAQEPDKLEDPKPLSDVKPSEKAQAQWAADNEKQLAETQRAVDELRDARKADKSARTQSAKETRKQIIDLSISPPEPPPSFLSRP